MANFKVPYEFVAGTKAKAEEVNSNFSAIKEELNKKLDISENGYITIKDAVSDNQPITKSQFEISKEELKTEIAQKIQNKELKKSFLFEFGNTNSNMKPDLLNIEDTSKVVFKVDDGTNYKSLKGVLADSTCFERTSIPDLSVGTLSSGTYNLFVGKEGDCIALANTVFRQKTIPPELVETVWSQPVLSAYGTLGSNAFAISALGSESGYPCWHLFDSNPNGNHTDYGAVPVQGVIIYNPIPIRMTKIEFLAEYTSSYRISGLTIYGSNDNSVYELIKSSTFNTTPNISFDISSNTKSFKYYKIIPTTSGYYPLYKDCKITAKQVVGNNLLNAVWLDTSFKPYVSKKYNGTTWETFDYVPLPQNITVKSGAISSVNKCGNFNDNGWDNYVMLPDMTKSTTLTKNSTFKPSLNGWLCKGGSMVRPLLIGETFTPSESGYIFYAMKGE